MLFGRKETKSSYLLEQVLEKLNKLLDRADQPKAAAADPMAIVAQLLASVKPSSSAPAPAAREVEE